MDTTQTTEFKTIQKNYYKRTFKGRFIALTMVGILLAFVTNYLIIFVQIYAGGLSGIAQGIAYTINDHVLVSDPKMKIVLYWAFYIVMNIPIIWFSLTRLGKRFTFSSMYVLGVNLSFSMFFAYVPGFKDVAFFSIEELQQSSELIKFLTYNLIGLIGGIMSGFAVGIAFKNKASTLGLDPVIKYYSKKKKISISKLMFIIAITNTIFFTFLDSILSKEIVDFTSFLKVFLNPKIFASILYFLGISVVSGLIYSTKNKIKVDVNSEKTTELSNKLNDINYHRNHTIYEAVGGFSKKSRNILSAIINEEELNDFLLIAQSIDPKSFIITSKVKETYGNFKNVPITLEDIEILQKEILKKQNRKKHMEANKNIKYNVLASLNNKWDEVISKEEELVSILNKNKAKIKNIKNLKKVKKKKGNEESYSFLIPNGNDLNDYTNEFEIELKLNDLKNELLESVTHLAEDEEFITIFELDKENKTLIEKIKKTKK